MALDLVRCLIGDPRKEICGNFHSGALKDQDCLSQDRPLPCGAVEKASSKEALSAVVESLLLDHFCNEGSTVVLFTQLSEVIRMAISSLHNLWTSRTEDIVSITLKTSPAMCQRALAPR